MTLSDIKFEYEDKLENLNNRIKRYEEIIKDYEIRIKEAEEEETTNLSSVFKAKADYEHRIKNMRCVKEYYQEFVDTADYLMQNLNHEEQFQLIIKSDALKQENENLKKEILHLEQVIQDNEEVLKHQKILYDLEKSKNAKLRKKHRSKIEDLQFKNQLEKNKNTEKIRTISDENKSLKKLKKDIKKVSAENQMLKDTNEFLERKSQKLQDYCNDLLNRKSIEQPHKVVPTGNSYDDLSSFLKSNGFTYDNISVEGYGAGAWINIVGIETGKFTFNHIKEVEELLTDWNLVGWDDNSLEFQRQSLMEANNELH